MSWEWFSLKEVIVNFYPGVFGDFGGFGFLYFFGFLTVKTGLYF